MNWIDAFFAFALLAIVVAAVSDAQVTTCQSGSAYAIVGLYTLASSPRRRLARVA